MIYKECLGNNEFHFLRINILYCFALHLTFLHLWWLFLKNKEIIVHGKKN